MKGSAKIFLNEIHSTDELLMKRDFFDCYIIHKVVAKSRKILYHKIIYIINQATTYLPVTMAGISQLPDPITGRETRQQHISGRRADQFSDAIKRPDVDHQICVSAGGMRDSKQENTTWDSEVTKSF